MRKETMSRGILLLLTCVLSVTYGYKEYQTWIPNGNSVLHPCGGAAMWHGVGHLTPEGGTRRNQFGLDFLKTKEWTETLCRLDSDGDGKSNGEELGDPDCKWRRGQEPDRTTGISHPGVCEPVDSPNCRSINTQFGESLNCDGKKFACPALSEPDTQQQRVRFPTTTVPAEVTNYYCMLFDLPSNGDFHLVATTPIINNTDIVHHMILFGCQIPESASSDVDPIKNNPYKCGMSPHKLCQQIIGTWTIGFPGDCLSKKAGFRVGTHGFKVAALQIHWNNRRAAAGQTDSSGMTLYYTANRRVYDAGVFVIGQEYLAIPPHAEHAAFDAKCPSDCTEQMFKRDVYVTRAVNHMHYNGKSQSVSLYRDGKKIRELTNDQNYDYDSPVFHHFDPPILLKRGDELRTRCVYKSKSSQVIYFGEGTNDEMCYAFLTYYPTHSLPPTLCASWKNIQRCQRYLPKFQGMLGDCRWRSLVKPDDNERNRIINHYIAPHNCGNFIKGQETQCNTNCSKVSQELAQHECLQGEVGDWVRYKLRTTPEGQVFVNTMKTCGAFVSRAALSYTHIGHSLFIISVLLYML